jgi:CheY-like chemotaxis protein
MSNDEKIIPCVLVAEDEETDVFIMQQALRKSGLQLRLRIVRDGEEAVNYLTCFDRTQNPLPRLLVLDLKMPRMTGFDVLVWLAGKPEFADLPRVVLSSSGHESDVARARELGALDYHIKPNSLPELVELLRQLHARWVQ